MRKRPYTTTAAVATRPSTPSVREEEEEDESGVRNPEAVGECFGTCAELPLLLATAAVGDYRHRGVLQAYAAVSKAFRAATLEATRQWCVQYQRLKRSWLASSLGSDMPKRFSALARMQALIDRAFGAGFVRAYGRAAWLASKYTPFSYAAMLHRRCVLCREEFVADPVAPLQLRRTTPSCWPSVAFAHVDCQRRHCVVCNADTIACANDVNPIRLTWSLMRLDDAVSAVSWYSDDFPRTGDKLVAAMSPFVRIVNPFKRHERRELPVVLWVRPHDAVEASDTLFGRLGYTAEWQQSCLDAASARRAELVAERTARVSALRETRRASAAEREAEFRLQLGAACMTWRTPEELDNFHPHACRLTGVDTLCAPTRMSASARSVLMRIRFLDRVLGDGALKPATVRFFLDTDEHFEQTMPSDWPEVLTSCVPRRVRHVDRLRPRQFTIKRVDDQTAKPGAEQWRMRSLIHLQGGVRAGATSVVYSLPADAFWMASAKLRLHGHRAPDPPDASATMEQRCEYVAGLVRTALACNACRGVAYELLGVSTYLTAPTTSGYGAVSGGGAGSLHDWGLHHIGLASEA